jgi:hypothetical protein
MRNQSMPRYKQILLAVVVLVVGAGVVARHHANVAIGVAPAVEAPLDHTDWHPADATTEVKWINDDAWSHVGGHCYGRKRDGSTRAATGEPGQVDLGEKFCIAFGAKDTPFDVPDQR